MAHNYYRIPTRCRIRALNEMVPSEPEQVSRNRCRRHRRKLRYLLNQFELRQHRTGKWMETHVWHAKRFHIGANWGVKYPLRCSDKSDRSTYRLVQRESACVMDKSYFNHFQCEFETETAAIEFAHKIFGLRLREGSVKAACELYDGTELIAPVTLLKVRNMVLLQVHPSASGALE